MATPPPDTSRPDAEKPKQRRKADGCQNCKVHRVKCDRQRPSCGCCVRRNEECNWSKIQFNTVNKRTNDKRTGRKVRQARESLAKQTGPTTFEFQTHPTQLSTSSRRVQDLVVMRRAPSHLPSPSASPDNLTDSPARSSSIHQLLWPLESTDSHQGSEAYPGELSFIHHTTPNTEPYVLTQEYSKLPCHSTSLGDCSWAWDGSVPSLPAPMDETRIKLEEYEACEESSQMSSPDGISIPRSDLSFSLAFAPPEVSLILKNTNARYLLNHYLHRTVVTLHPEQDLYTNKSKSLFLPYCLRSAGALEGILAFSAAQLVIDNPAQSDALLYHKNRALSSLNQLVFLQTSKGKWSNHPRHSLDAVAVAVLAQISLCVSESGTENWKLHCGAAYELLALMEVPTELSDPLRTYLYARLLKYACFAEISHPTTRRLDLTMIRANNLDADFGVPCTGLKLAVLVTWYGYRVKIGINESALAAHKREIDSILREYMADELDTALQTLSEAQLVASIWRTAVWLYYTRTIFNTSLDHPSSSLAVTRLCQLLRMMPLNSLYGTALAFPVLTIVPMIDFHQQEIRSWISSFCKNMAKCTHAGNFLKIEEFAHLAWVEVDLGRCQTVSEVRALAESSGYEILAA